MDMDDLPDINLSKEQESLLEPVIHVYDWPEQKFKKKYNQQIKSIDFTEIRDVIHEHILMCVKTVHGQRAVQKLIAGLDKILCIQAEYINNDLKHIVIRFTAELVSASRKRSSKAQGKGKSRKPKREVEYDDSSVIFLFEKEDEDIDLAKVFENDKNVKDKNLIEEIIEPDEDKQIAEASYFGPASKEELLFNWDNVEPVPSLIKTKTTDQGKYGVFARAEKQVLDELEQHPSNTPPEVLPDNITNDEGNFGDFLQHMGEALPEIPLTPSKRKQRGNRDSTETPSKRNRIEDGTSALSENATNGEGNFANFSQHIGEALPDIPPTPLKRKQEGDRDSIETPSKRNRRNLNEQLKASQAESSDDAWILPEIEKSEYILKKNKKKKKKKPLFDEETMIEHNLTNIYAQTVSLKKRMIQPRNIVIPAVELLNIPSSVFAKNKKRKPISRVLLEKFQLVADHPHKRNENEFEINNSDLRALSSVGKQTSELRAPALIDNIELSSMEAKLEGDTRDKFPIEESEVEGHITMRSHDVAEFADPPSEINPLEQDHDTVPVTEVDRFSSSVDNPQDLGWNEEYVYQKIKQLCTGGVRITFRDLAPIPETKRQNRVYAFAHITNLANANKICTDQDYETKVITIWVSTDE